MELWTASQAAQYWGVSSARARGILSTRRIARVSGYPADDIRAVQRRQGARTDLAAPHIAWSLAAIADAMSTHANDDTRRLRLFFEFMRGADEVGVAALPLTTEEPALTGDTRFDALLAAGAEQIATRFGRPGPLWSLTIDRFLAVPWWISSLASARAEAMVWTPASFRRRGIFLARRDLSNDGFGPFMAEPLFGSSDTHIAFSALAEKLQRRKTVGQVHVVGGAATVFAFDPRRTSARDIDALFAPDGAMIAAIREVAAEKAWSTAWLSDQAVMYVSRSPGEGERVFDHAHLQVMAAPTTSWR